MKHIAIIGASYLQLPLIIKAKEMGFCTHVFAWKVDDVGEMEADFFYPISIIEHDKILKKCEEIIELFETTKNTKTSMCSEEIKTEQEK